MTKEIKLTQGKVAVVDDDDFEELNRYKWHAWKHGNTFYAVRNETKRKKIGIHTQITGYKMTDHKDGDGLKNTRSNLRECTSSQNHMNQKKKSNATSQFKGVCWHKASSKFRAQIRINGNAKNLGLFSTEKEAALAYNVAAKEHFREFARLNDV